MKTKAIGIFILGLVNFGYAQTDINAGLIYTGLEQTPPQEFIKIPKDLDYSEGIRETKLPSYWDLSLEGNFPPHLDQKNTSACTIFALSYALKTFQESEDYGHNIYDKEAKPIDSLVFSPSYLFKVFKQGKNCGDGINLNEALLYLETYGTVSIKDLPFDENEVLNNCEKPGEKLIDKGRVNRIANFYVLSKDDRERYNPEELGIITRIKKRIYNRHPVVISVEYNDQFKAQNYSRFHPKDKYPIWDNKSSRMSEKYHALLIVGYDDSISAFKVYNSWGKYGYIWMTYEVFNKLSTYEIYVTVDVPHKYHSNYLNIYASEEQAFDWERNKSSLSEGKIGLAAGIKEHSYISNDLFEFSNLKTDDKSKSVHIGVKDRDMEGKMFKFVQSVGDTVQIGIGKNQYTFFLDSIDNQGSLAFLRILVEGDVLYSSEEFLKKFPVKAQNLRDDKLSGKSYRFKNIYVTLESNGILKASAKQTNNRWAGWHGKIIFRLFNEQQRLIKEIETPSYGQNGVWESGGNENERVINFETLITDRRVLEKVKYITIEPKRD